MTITNTQLIRDALRLIGVLAETETASAEQAADGLRVMNHMLAEWERDGINLEYYAQTVADLGGNTPIPDSAVAAVKYLLAVSLAPEFGRTVTPEIATLADKYLTRLKRDAVLENMQTSRLTHMPLGEAYVDHFDITNG